MHAQFDNDCCQLLEHSKGQLHQLSQNKPCSNPKGVKRVIPVHTHTQFPRMLKKEEDWPNAFAWASAFFNFIFSFI